jgi:hypothetical protein
VHGGTDDDVAVVAVRRAQLVGAGRPLLRVAVAEAQLHAVERLADATRWAGAETAAIVEASVAELVTITREKRPIIAAFLANALEDPVLLEGGLRFRRNVEERLSALFLTRRDEMTHPDPALAIELAIQTAFAIMQQHVLIEETRAQGRALTDEELRRELTTLVLRYVGIEPRRRRSARDCRR